MFCQLLQARRFHSDTGVAWADKCLSSKKNPNRAGPGLGYLLACPAITIIASAYLSVNITKGTPCPESPDQSPHQTGRLWTRRDSNLSRFGGVSEAGASRRNPERREGPPSSLTGQRAPITPRALGPVSWLLALENKFMHNRKIVTNTWRSYEIPFNAPFPRVMQITAIRDSVR